ncbi:hypothetical protein [Aquimarina litoralis]|uniref:hypothetical protein n=1 Tax=Aquimarina litoralis TaxID=584605 RepID=UPI001C5A02C8|nr:hypothetical protein [Aquimarina litoralis]MBW1298853.1 hypothetical protein [Aquimarina litoralis]
MLKSILELQGVEKLNHFERKSIHAGNGIGQGGENGNDDISQECTPNNCRPDCYGIRHMGCL